MKLKTFCSYLWTITLAICACMSLTAGQKDVNCRQQNGNKSAPKYRIAYRDRTKANPSILEVHISIAPKHFNRDDMIALAGRLNKDFSREQRVTVVICDEYETAKDPAIVYDLLRRSPPLALRGFYEIDRVGGKEGISFSTNRGNPLDEVDIDLSKKP